MKLALVQTHLHWENKEKNIQHFSEIIDNSEPADVYILPEMFTTGFTMNSSKLAEPIDGNTTQWMLQKAQSKHACLVGSIITKEHSQYYNSLIWAYPNGNFQFYHKRHLFRMAEENQHYSPGQHKIICAYKGFRFMPLICYDLRFPVWSRNQFSTEYEYDVLIYLANWPAVRMDAWKKLLFARAIENLSYCVGVNRIGTDGTQKEYNGQSMAINFKGEIVCDLATQNSIAYVELDKSQLEEFRQKFPAYLDADTFEILS